jgi:hypothetical protein
MNPTTLFGFASEERPPEIVILALEVPSGAPNPSVALFTKEPGTTVST